MKKVFISSAIALIIAIIACHKEPTTGWISIKSTPSGAGIYIDDSLTGMQTDCILEDVNPGEHVISLKFDMYLDRKDTVEVVAGDTTIAEFTLTEEGTLRWNYIVSTITQNDAYASCPAIGSDGNIYWGSRDGYIYAFTPDGTLLWSFNTGGIIIASVSIATDGTIYCNLTDGNLCALNPNGTLKWKVPTGLSLSSPAQGDSGIVYVATRDAKVLAVDSAGIIKWVREIDRGYLSASPVVGSDGSIYISNDGLVVLTSDGEVILDYFVYTGFESNYSSTPALGSNMTIYFLPTALESHLYALDASGTLLWKSTKGFNSYESPVIGSDGSIYLERYAFTPSGSVLWESNPGSFSSAPAIGSDGIIYYSTQEFSLCAKNPDGSIRWSYQADSTYPTILSSPALGMDGTIYFASNKGNLYAVYTNSHGLMNSAWPKLLHDSRNSGNASWPIH